jgi:hypothetical protein
VPLAPAYPRHNQRSDSQSETAIERTGEIRLFRRSPQPYPPEGRFLALAWARDGLERFMAIGVPLATAAVHGLPSFQGEPEPRAGPSVVAKAGRLEHIPPDRPAPGISAPARSGAFFVLSARGRVVEASTVATTMKYIRNAATSAPACTKTTGVVALGGITFVVNRRSPRKFFGTSSTTRTGRRDRPRSRRLTR